MAKVISVLLSLMTSVLSWRRRLELEIKPIMPA